ncbi:alkaline phosphatase D family protein [Stackebrandtia nassauensis]|uniref:Uncharacterized protein n=1 Tax=Stackebrandtia nassauensis (strain DSM 44728 / CIP 108903 / NRRL B-16338 / NBRC 102104 / LLR-40K-21) TaxID=446470 RepID=D3PZB2_STANL|nr:alkaline phosphatase D family protein [Stackebrandtia nassauensis]ADD41586.1 hypothetical protein Snas_1890 [Stackebrandtia nassauensis DSM 44728]
MAQIVLGPMLRRVDESTAAVWVETDSPCRVGVLDASAATFTVHGHHYALVEVSGLAPGSVTPYTVTLDGRTAWPEADSEFPPPVIRTVNPDGDHRLVLGSCRVSADEQYGDARFGVDMLAAFAHQLAADGDGTRPDALLMLGDQVYADIPPEEVRQFIRDRRDVSVPPGEEIADFEEYAELYRQSWAQPAVRWLLSTVPMLAIFDDHDLRDDWNTSMAWRDTMLKQPWWKRRVIAGLGSYWIYQHLGNMSPKDRAEDPLFAALRESDGDGAAALDEFAWRAWEDSTSVRWSFQQEFGGTRLIMLDSRCARDLTPRKRRIVDEPEWDWFREQATAECDQLLIASSVPVLLPTGLHYVESWNEAVCDGVWGKTFAKLAEKIRQTIDLEHWGAFRESFQRMSFLIMERVRGNWGKAPAAVVFLSGDVHYSYLAKARIRSARGMVHQVTCSAIRHPLPRLLRWANVVGSVRVAGIFGYLLARLARVHRTPFSWRMNRGPWFDNALATVDLSGRKTRARWHTASVAEPKRLRELGSAELS